MAATTIMEISLKKIVLFYFQLCAQREKNIIDNIIDNGSKTAGEIDYEALHGTYVY
jgi:hypothetical protein